MKADGALILIIVMYRFPILLVFACGLISYRVAADDELAKGKLLVATELVQGPRFGKTVVLVLSYDANGTIGLVVNRRTEVAPAEALPDFEGLDRYQGALYYGGPVQLNSIHALLVSDAPPDDAAHIFDSVHLVPLDDSLLEDARDSANLRFFLGYAGWAPGQLEREMAFGSWHVVAATEEIVFAQDTGRIWPDLLPPRVHKASIEPGSTRSGPLQWGFAIRRSTIPFAALVSRTANPASNLRPTH